MLGLGPAGQMAARIALHLGVERVIGVGRGPDDVFEDLPEFPGSPVADLLSVDDAVFQVPSIFEADARQAA